MSSGGDKSLDVGTGLSGGVTFGKFMHFAQTKIIFWWGHWQKLIVTKWSCLFLDCASVFASVPHTNNIFLILRTYIFLRQIPKCMLSLSGCLKQSPLLPSPSSLMVSSSQSSSLLHHLKREDLMVPTLIIHHALFIMDKRSRFSLPLKLNQLMLDGSYIKTWIQNFKNVKPF